MKLIPRSRARLTIGRLAASSSTHSRQIGSPIPMAPSPNLEILRFEEPRFRYSICSRPSEDAIAGGIWTVYRAMRADSMSDGAEDESAFPAGGLGENDANVREFLGNHAIRSRRQRAARPA